MNIATWGSKIFKVSSKKVYTFSDMSRSASYNTEEQENGTKKPKLKNKAPALETMSIKVELSYLYCDVRKEIQSWINLQGKYYYFIIGSEQYGTNKWELVGVDASEQKFAVGGTLKSATLSLSFKEKVVKKTSSKTAKQTRNAKG